MNKELIVVILWAVLAVALILPLVVLSYAIVFGHNFSENQMWAAFGMACAGGFSGLLVAFNWDKL